MNVDPLLILHLHDYHRNVDNLLFNIRQSDIDHVHSDPKGMRAHVIETVCTLLMPTLALARECPIRHPSHLLDIGHARLA